MTFAVTLACFRRILLACAYPNNLTAQQLFIDTSWMGILLD